MNTNPDLETDIPLEVYAFFRDLNRAADREDVEALHNLYEVQFENLTKNYYIVSNQPRPWPSLRLQIVSENFTNKMAESIYSFLYFKHLFTDRAVQQSDATASWATYTELLNAIATDRVDLPPWMLWDIFDEFVFQITAVYQKRFSTPTEWSVTEAFRIMDHIVSTSRITKIMQNPEELERITKPGNTCSLGGFFAVITKAKINVLLGDYYAALSGLKMIDIFGAGQSVLLRVSPAYVSLLYNVGFSYLMLHRYEDASNSFRRCLAAKLTGRKFLERLQLDAAYMYVCARVLGGMVVANVSSYIEQRRRANFDDDKESLRMGDEERFCDVFDRHSPKFLSVAPASAAVKGTEGKELQARMFRRAVQQQQEIMRLRDFFGVYQNTKVSQLQMLLDTEDSYAPFFALKMRSRQLVHDGESANLLSGIYRVSSQNDCIVQGDNVEVVPCTNYGSTETKLYGKIRTFQRLELRQTQRKQNQPKDRRDGDRKAQHGGAKRPGRNGQNTNGPAGQRRPNNNEAGGPPPPQPPRRPNNSSHNSNPPQGGGGGSNRRPANPVPVVATPADNLFNRNA